MMLLLFITKSLLTFIKCSLTRLLLAGRLRESRGGRGEAMEDLGDAHRLGKALRSTTYTILFALCLVRMFVNMTSIRVAIYST